LKEGGETKQIESKDQVKSTKKILMENQIKLEKLLLALDALVGASEDVRPQKKKLVVEIQETINELDKILAEEVKPIEKIIEQHQINEKKMLEEKKSEEISQKNEMKDESEEKEVEEQKVEEQSEEVQQESPQKTPSSPKMDSREDNEEEEDEEESNFPFPSKEDWEKLKFEPNFNVQQFRDKYVLSSKIPNLQTEKVSVVAKDGVLTIEGIKYPTKEEKNLLAKKLVQSLRNPSVLNRSTKSQIISAILSIASDYNFGKFSVKYRLPSHIDAEDDINATYKNGILQIELPTKNKVNPLHSQNYYKPEVPFYGYNRRPNSFWNF